VNFEVDFFIYVEQKTRSEMVHLLLFLISETFEYKVTFFLTGILNRLSTLLHIQ
jgi:hypothetical protein